MGEYVGEVWASMRVGRVRVGVEAFVFSIGFGIYGIIMMVGLYLWLGLAYRLSVSVGVERWCLQGLRYWC